MYNFQKEFSEHMWIVAILITQALQCFIKNSDFYSQSHLKMAFNVDNCVISILLTYGYIMFFFNIDNEYYLLFFFCFCSCMYIYFFFSLINLTKDFIYSLCSETVVKIKWMKKLSSKNFIECHLHCLVVSLWTFWKHFTLYNQFLKSTHTISYMQSYYELYVIIYNVGCRQTYKYFSNIR